MIAFNDQRIETRQYLADILGYVPDIGQQPKAPTAVRKDILDRFPCIVRNGKRQDIERTDPERLVTIDDPHIHAFGQGTTCDMRSVTEPYGESVAPGKWKDTPNMIAVFMSHKNPGNIAGFPFQAGKTAKRLAQPETTIDHQAGGIAFDQQCVTRAAATQRCKPDHCNCW